MHKADTAVNNRMMNSVNDRITTVSTRAAFSLKHIPPYSSSRRTRTSLWRPCPPRTPTSLYSHRTPRSPRGPSPSSPANLWAEEEEAGPSQEEVTRRPTPPSRTATWRATEASHSLEAGARTGPRRGRTRWRKTTGIACRKLSNNTVRLLVTFSWGFVSPW